MALQINALGSQKRKNNLTAMLKYDIYIYENTTKKLCIDFIYIVFYLIMQTSDGHR